MIYLLIFFFLSINNSLDLNYVYQNPNKNWERDYISINPNIENNEQIDSLKYRKLINYNLLMENKFTTANNKLPYKFSNYRKYKTKKILNKIEEELIKITWNPKRVIDWCLVFNEKIE